MWIGTVVLDSSEPKRLAKFWAEALGYKIKLSEENWAGIAEPKREHVRLSLQYEKEPKISSNPLYFDVYVHDMDGEVERLTKLGTYQKY